MGLVFILFTLMASSLYAQSSDMRSFSDDDLNYLTKKIWKKYLSADIRIREEAILNEQSKQRYRLRERLRLGLKLPISEQLTLGTRFVTGDALDPTTGNVDLDGFFAKKGINLDRLYLKYTPFNNFVLFAGKFANPFEHVELVFHNDVQLEGLANKFSIKNVSFIDKIDFNLGHFIINEAEATPDTTFHAAQIYFKGFATKGLSFGTTYYNFQNSDSIAQAYEGKTPKLTSADTNNRVGKGTGNSSFLYKFKIIESLAKYEFNIKSTPLWLLFANANNTDAKENNQAYWGEIGAGPVESLKNLKMHYRYVYVEQESMISSFSNADMFSPNIKGSEFKLSFSLAKNITLETLYFWAKKINTTASANPMLRKVRFQIKAKF